MEKKRPHIRVQGGGVFKYVRYVKCDTKHSVHAT